MANQKAQTTETTSPTLAEILSSMAAELAAIPEAPEAVKATRGVKRQPIALDAHSQVLCTLLGSITPCVAPSGSAGWGKPADSAKPVGGSLGRVILACGTPAKHGSLRLVLALLAAGVADGTISLPTFPADADGRQRWGLLATFIARRSGLRMVLRQTGEVYLTSLKSAGSTDDSSPTDG
jgi:hypothetical protein